MINQEMLKRLLEYDPDTGLFTRISYPHKNARKRKRAGYTDPSHGYRKVQVSGKHYYEHRLAWLYMTGGWPVKQIDHINGIRSDNRWANLRDVTQSENNQNKALKDTNGTSKLLGVCWHKRAGKWMAQIKINGVRYYLGLFEGEAEAHRAYMAAKKELHTYGGYNKPAAYECGRRLICTLREDW